MAPVDAGYLRESGPPPAHTNGFVLRYADLPPIDIGTGSSGSNVSTVTTSGGPGIDPNTQYIMLGTTPSTCQKPYASGACGTWQVSIAIPPALFRPGVLSLGCGGVNAYFSETEPAGPSGDCSGGGGGTFWQGTIEILGINDTEVIFRLANTLKFGFDADGFYVLHRCP
jgi:hypothetical protein